MLNERENFLRALSGETPEYVPRYNHGWGIRPSFLLGDRDSSGAGKDIFGIDWTKDGSSIDGAIPKPGEFLLDDIRRWRDVVRFPDFSDLDWEAVSRKDLANHNPDQPVGAKPSGIGFFQAVVSLMGFTEGLIACFEEPEEVKALINHMCDYHLAFADKVIQYYTPDYIAFGDDIAHERNPFISLEAFRDIFAPVWRRFIKFFKDKGYLATLHNCGHFEAFLDDAVDMGFNSWDPAQTSNDLIAIKKKFGNKLLICGGFDSRAFLPHLDVTEEEVRAAVKKVLDDLAPGGGYAFAGGVMSENDADVAAQRSKWINDEYERLKFSYYS